MTNIGHKLWIVVEGDILGSAFHSPDAATAEAKKLASTNIGRQYLVLEAMQAYEAEPRVKSTDLYRNWEAQVAPLATSMDEPNLSALLEPTAPPSTSSNALIPTDF